MTKSQNYPIMAAENGTSGSKYDYIDTRFSFILKEGRFFVKIRPSGVCFELHIYKYRTNRLGFTNIITRNTNNSRP